MKQKKPFAIQLSGVSKKYEIHHEKPTLVERFTSRKVETFWALNNITLDIKKGEKVGIIGRNGSGKTTLLKVMSGIATPTLGRLQTHGRVVSLIDLGAGFHSDISGYQNIYLNGMLLGLHKDEIDSKIQDIIDFADLKQFIDAPLFTYSSGMMLRLGFAIAVHADPDILLLDENLSAGDANFQEKSRKKLKKFFTREKTIVAVTHNLDFLATMCNRILHIRRGEIVNEGGTEILSQYDPAWRPKSQD